MSRFENKSAVITGGTKGIGGATVEAFLKEGAKVANLDVDKRAESHDRLLSIECDVSHANEVDSAIARAKEEFGGIDVLVNNAGIQHYGTVTETTEHDWDNVLGVNLKSAFLCSKACIPTMLDGGGGVIINVSSVQAFLSQPKVAPYTTSKTALLGLTRSIAVDYAPTIRSVAVCPGTVDTPMLRWSINQSPNPEEVLQECNEMHPVQRIARPEEIANLILYLSSPDAAFITGQAFRIDGGLGLSLGGSNKN